MSEEEVLLTSVLNCERADLYLKPLTLNAQESAILSSARAQRAQGIPLQYILKDQEFFGLTFRVDERVLIPRPETEILVEEAIRIADSVKRIADRKEIKILDVGTGSGCIAIALAKSLPQAKIFAVDVSHDALIVARENARMNGVDERVNFIQSDLLSAIRYPLSAFDMIVSNPPYVSSSDLATLQKEVRYEPKIALDGGREGLDFYKIIIQESPKFIKQHGLLLMEMGFGQAEKIKDMFQKSGKFAIIDVVKDYSGIERVIISSLS